VQKIGADEGSIHVEVACSGHSGGSAAAPSSTTLREQIARVLKETPAFFRQIGTGLTCQFNTSDHPALQPLSHAALRDFATPGQACVTGTSHYSDPSSTAAIAPTAFDTVRSANNRRCNRR
jgi:hypothetical protein